MFVACLFFSISVTVAIYAAATYFGRKKSMAERFEQLKSSQPIASGVLKKKESLSDIQSFGKLLEASQASRQLAFRLRIVGLRTSVSVFYLSSFILFIVLLSVFQMMFPLSAGILLALALTALPFGVVHILYKRYLAKFAEYLPTAIAIMGSAIRVGHSLEKAIEAVTQTAPSPVKDEFRIVLNEMSLGLSLSKALDNMYLRFKNPDLKILITGIKIQQELGGNLSEMLENLEKTIRERFSLIREVKVLSAQGRISAWILFAIPFGLMAAFFWQSSELMLKFIQSPTGHIVLGICGVLQLFGFIGMQKVINLGD